MRYLLLSHTHAFGPFRVGSHHIARELARRGHKVVHYSTPSSLAHRLLRRQDERPRVPVVDADGVRHLAPDVAIPAGLRPPPLRAHLLRHGCPTHYDVVLIDQPLLWAPDLTDLGTRVVYRPTDLYPSGLKAHLQRRILAEADAVITTSREVLRALGDLTLPSLVLENGVETGRFPAPAAGTRPRVAAYVGAIDERFDVDALRSLAQGARDWTFLVAGPPRVPLRGIPSNVRLLGAVPYERIPPLLGGARIGLLPLSDSPLNDGRSPMKLFEYLASGLSVVTRCIPGLDDDPATGVFAYRSHEGLPMAFARAAQAPSPNIAGRKRAERMGWDRRVDALERFVDEVST